MRFSQRKGYRPVKQTIQQESMDDDLRNSLWNVLDIAVFQRADFYDRSVVNNFLQLGDSLWVQYFKLPIDTRPWDEGVLYTMLREYYFGWEWYEVYDFLEFIVNYIRKNRVDPQLESLINNILSTELAGYRFIDGVLTDVTDETEVELLTQALEDNEFPGVKRHLQRALELLSDRKQPDYRNSIKESISAVESLAQTISGNKNATLGDALQVIEKRGSIKIHPALREAFSKLYGYTSAEGGIRHAMFEEPNLTVAEAKYFLFTCTSFINYLKSKI